jgi:hypothetical protein
MCAPESDRDYPAHRKRDGNLFLNEMEPFYDPLLCYLLLQWCFLTYEKTLIHDLFTTLLVRQ